MYASYQIRTSKRPSSHHTMSVAMMRTLRSGMIWTILASLLVCAAIGWLAYEICNRTDIASISIQTDMPRNQVEMHNFYG